MPAFTTRDGTAVKFTTKRKKRRSPRATSAHTAKSSYRTFARVRLKKYIANGMSAPAAMKRVGKEWRAR